MRRKGFVIGAIAARSRLFLGKDHLLSVDSARYTEEYKRFYFRDIQAITIRQTGTGKIINVVLGVLAIPPLVATLATAGGFRIFWAIVTSVFLVFLLANTLSGPTCTCHMRTAVQTEELPSLRRLRRARKVLARLRPFLTAEQGELPPHEIALRMAELAKPPIARETYNPSRL